MLEALIEEDEEFTTSDDSGIFVSDIPTVAPADVVTKAIGGGSVGCVSEEDELTEEREGDALSVGNG